VLPLTIWVSGAPFAVAIVGVFVYRVLALLLPMPVSLDPMRLLTTRGHRERTSVRAASGCARSLSQFPQAVVLPEVGR
jgi:hypothetical protein